MSFIRRWLFGPCGGFSSGSLAFFWTFCLIPRLGGCLPRILSCHTRAWEHTNTHYHIQTRTPDQSWCWCCFQIKFFDPCEACGLIFWIQMNQIFVLSYSCSVGIKVYAAGGIYRGFCVRQFWCFGDGKFGPAVARWGKAGAWFDTEVRPSAATMTKQGNESLKSDILEKFAGGE